MEKTSPGPDTPADSAKPPRVFKAPIRDEVLFKLERKILTQVGKAIGDFKMIEEGDRIMVGVSGGKDSWVMLHILDELRRKAPVKFEIVAVNLDQGYEGFRQDIVEDYLAEKGITYHMAYSDIATPVLEKSADGTVPCSLCSRLRRGNLYTLAPELKCNKIALGHHLDDMIETLLLNVFFIGKMASMAPKLVSDDKKNIVIRPLIYVREDDIISFSQKMDFPIVCCQCPLMCGNDVHADFKRMKIKKLLKDLEKEIPVIKNSLIASLSNVNPSHLLDRDLWDFSLNKSLLGPLESDTHAQGLSENS